MSGGSMTWEDAQLQLISQNITLIKRFQVLKYVNVAFLTILVYDHLSTLDLEMKRIWTLPWKLPKYLFVVNRYILPPFLFFEAFSNTTPNVGPNICKAKLFTSFPTMIFIMTVELMLMLRILALYGNSKKMARFFIVLSAFQLSIWAAIGVLILTHSRGIPGRHVFSGCLYVAPDYTFVGWIPGLVFETIILILTIHKCLKFRISKFPPTLEVLIRDSVVYFIAVNAILAFNTFYSIFGDKLIAPSLFLPSGVVTSIAAARLTISLRRFTMDEGMSTLGEGFQTFMPSARGRGNQRNTGQETYNLSLPSVRQGSSLGALEDLQSRGRSLAQSSSV